MSEVKSRFYFVDCDIQGRDRLYFDNAGCSFRQKAALEAFSSTDALPDCPERIHELSVYLQDIQTRGTEDIRTILNANGGSVYAGYTASAGMFAMVRSY